MHIHFSCLWDTLYMYVFQLSPSDADIATSNTTKMDEAKQEARKMNMAVLAVSLQAVQS